MDEIKEKLVNLQYSAIEHHSLFSLPKEKFCELLREIFTTTEIKKRTVFSVVERTKKIPVLDILCNEPEFLEEMKPVYAFIFKIAAMQFVNAANFIEKFDANVRDCLIVYLCNSYCSMISTINVRHNAAHIVAGQANCINKAVIDLFIILAKYRNERKHVFTISDPYRDVLIAMSIKIINQNSIELFKSWIVLLEASMKTKNIENFSSPSSNFFITEIFYAANCQTRQINNVLSPIQSAIIELFAKKNVCVIYGSVKTIDFFLHVFNDNDTLSPEIVDALLCDENISRAVRTFLTNVKNHNALKMKYSDHKKKKEISAILDKITKCNDEVINLHIQKLRAIAKPQ